MIASVRIIFRGGERANHVHSNLQSGNLRLDGFSMSRQLKATHSGSSLEASRPNQP